MKNYNILILGASYGSLFASKLLLAGHKVTLVCTKTTADLINTKGTIVRLPVRAHETLIELSSKQMPAQLTAALPEAVDVQAYDLVVFAMQEPQYSAPAVHELMNRIANARVPCLAIMNMPPLAFLKRIAGLSLRELYPCYKTPELWNNFEPGLVTLASPDPQAFRPAAEKKNVLQVGLASNFKTAPFENEAHTQLLRQLQTDIKAIRYPTSTGKIALPVKLWVSDSLFVPLAKWLMLLTGNYRCIQRDSMISIKDAVHSDLQASREIYNWVAEVCMKLGAAKNDLVAFEKYAQAANSLLKPSSAARALFNGATDIERVDLLVQLIAKQFNMQHSAVDQIVELVDYHLQANRAI